MYIHEEMLNRIKEEMRILGVNIKELALKCDIPYRTLYKVISGETQAPSVNLIIKIAETLNVSADYLIFGKEFSCNPNSYKLSEQEKFLIDNFRGLNAQGQDYILQTIDMVKDKYKKSISSQGIA